MPLHNWKDDRGWDSVHLVWLAQLLDWVQPRLPGSYRAYLGSVPALTVDVPAGRPDLSVRNWPTAAEKATQVALTSTDDESEAPDEEAVATFILDPQRAVHIDLDGVLVAAIEIVSPRNKDRPAARERYLRRYAGYLRQGVHLLLVDALPLPAGFSFADSLAVDLGLLQAACPAPFAVSYRVGEAVPEGTIVGVWRRPLAIGEPLPAIPLALRSNERVQIDLDYTYAEAARRAYLP